MCPVGNNLATPHSIAYIHFNISVLDKLHSLANFLDSTRNILEAEANRTLNTAVPLAKIELHGMCAVIGFVYARY
jgi:hypothetical protein